MSTHGAYRTDGSWIGFDYEQQAWIDTDPNAERDPTCKPGSASNPLAHRNDAPHEAYHDNDLEASLERPGALSNLPHDA